MGRGGCPPRLGRFLVRLLVPAHLREEIEGDLTERWEDKRRLLGPRAAAGWYWRQVIRLRPWGLRTAAETRAAGRGTGFGGSWIQELHQSWRGLKRRPVATLTVVGTIALAIGATAVVFSVVNGVLLRPLPYPDSHELVRLWQTKESWRDSPNNQLRAFADRLPLSMPTSDDWLRESSELSDLGVYSNRSRVWKNPDGADVVYSVIATSGVFSALAVAPAMGRVLAPGDDRPGASLVAVLSHGLWQTRFGGRADVLGQSVPLGEELYTVVGVMPPDFGFPRPGIDLWTSMLPDERDGERDSQFLSAIGRVRDGGSIDAVRQEIEAIQGRLATVYPDEQGDHGARVVSLLEATVGETRTTLWFLFGAVGLVLLIACANITSVLSALATSRRREMSVRAALGARARDLARGRLVDGALLAGLGGAAGFAVAVLCMPALLGVLPDTLPRRTDIGIDLRVIGFGVLVTTVVTLLVGLAPAIQASGADPASAMSEGARGVAGGRRSSRLRGGLVILETALAFMLMVGAGLLGKSYLRLWTVDRGFPVESLAYMELVPDEVRYPDVEARARFRGELRNLLAEIPGAAFSASNQIPLSGSTSSTSFEVERAGEGEDEVNVLISSVLPDYFDVMSIPIVAGRLFAESDDGSAPLVAVVNQAMADRHWPGQSALGKRLRDDAEDPWITVVGVVGNVRHQGLDVEPEPKLYLPAFQSGRDTNMWVVRAVGDMGAVLGLARERVGQLSPDTLVRRTEILAEKVAASVAVPRFRMLFVVGLAAMSGLLALLGIYGLVAFSVAESTREIGVRIALGADGGRVVKGVLGVGTRLAVAGIVIGFGSAMAAAGVLRQFLYRVEPGDPWVFGAVGVLVLAVSALAGWVPARRAASVDPISVLSAE